MDLMKKMDYVSNHLKSIATHTDADAAVRLAALDMIVADVNKHKANIDDEIKDKIKKQLGE